MPEIVPWWNHLQLRKEITDASGIVDDDVQMSLYKVIYGTAEERPRYADPGYYGEITHPTIQLRDLLTRISIRLAGGQGGMALVRLDQAMGGGKSHACVGAYHLANSPELFCNTELGTQVFDHAVELGHDLPRTLDNPHVVVLSCDNMTPGETDDAIDGPVAQSLYERFLWRLVEGDMSRYDQFSRDWASKAAISSALRSVGRPVLIIIDEVINYVGRGLGGLTDDNAALVNQDMAFLRALTEAVKDTPKVSMLVVMISTDKDTTALDAAGQARRDEFDRDLKRNGRALPVNENTDFAAILQRRLFTKPVDAQAFAHAVDATALAYQQFMDDGQWRQNVFAKLNALWVKDLITEVRRTYPFHPQLMDLAEQEWANLAGFQKVRDTIKIFAASVYALSQRAVADAWVPALIGPGDIPLSDLASREALLNSGLLSDAKTAANYRSLAQNDVIALSEASGTARLLDTERRPAAWITDNPRSGERAATAIFVTSVMPLRKQNRRGAAEAEVNAAMAVPSATFQYADADGVVKELIDPERGLTTIEIISGKGGQQPRYFMSTQQRLPMLVRAMRNTVTDEQRDAAIAECVAELVKNKPGPFQQALFVRHTPGQTARDSLLAANLDQPRVTRLVALDPAAFTLRNGEEAATEAAAKEPLGLGDNPMPVTWASSLILAVATTHGRSQARGMAADYLAHQKVIDTTEEQAEENDFLQEAGPARDSARARLKQAVERAFGNLLYLQQSDGIRTLENVALPNGQCALRGDDVWHELAHRQKAFAPQTFTVQSLLYNLRKSDYGRPLSEIRDAFWGTPRLPLLPDGEEDLRKALYDAVREGKLLLVRADGEEVAVTHPNEINLSNQGLRLQRPAPAADKQKPSDEGHPKPVFGSGQNTANRQDPSPAAPSKATATPPASAKQLSFVINKNLAQDPDSAIKLGEFLRELWVALDSGDASYILAQMRIVISAEHVEAISDKAEELEIRMTVTDQ